MEGDETLSENIQPEVIQVVDADGSSQQEALHDAQHDQPLQEEVEVSVRADRQSQLEIEKHSHADQTQEEGGAGQVDPVTETQDEVRNTE